MKHWSNFRGEILKVIIFNIYNIKGVMIQTMSMKIFLFWSKCFPQNYIVHL